MPIQRNTTSGPYSSLSLSLCLSAECFLPLQPPPPTPHPHPQPSVSILSRDLRRIAVNSHATSSGPSAMSCPITLLARPEIIMIELNPLSSARQWWARSKRSFSQRPPFKRSFSPLLSPWGLLAGSPASQPTAVFPFGSVLAGERRRSRSLVYLSSLRCDRFSGSFRVKGLGHLIH